MIVSLNYLILFHVSTYPNDMRLYSVINENRLIDVSLQKLYENCRFVLQVACTAGYLAKNKWNTWIMAFLKICTRRIFNFHHGNQNTIEITIINIPTENLHWSVHNFWRYIQRSKFLIAFIRKLILLKPLKFSSQVSIFVDLALPQENK